MSNNMKKNNEQKKESILSKFENWSPKKLIENFPKVKSINSKTTFENFEEVKHMIQITKPFVFIPLIIAVISGIFSVGPIFEVLTIISLFVSGYFYLFKMNRLQLLKRIFKDIYCKKCNTKIPYNDTSVNLYSSSNYSNVQNMSAGQVYKKTYTRCTFVTSCPNCGTAKTFSFNFLIKAEKYQDQLCFKANSPSYVKEYDLEEQIQQYFNGVIPSGQEE